MEESVQGGKANVKVTQGRDVFERLRPEHDVVIDIDTNSFDNDSFNFSVQARDARPVLIAVHL